MTLLTLLLRLGLSAIFAIAGIAKIGDQRGSRRAVINFGVPEKLAPAFAAILPAIELLIAAGLLFGTTVWWSALASVLLLGLFMIAIGVNLSLGRTHDCHCFGQLHSSPLGWSTLAKNLVFVLAAIVLLFEMAQPLSVVETFSGLSKSEAELVVAILLVASCLLVHWQTQGNRQVGASRTESLPLNTLAPAFELASYDGGSRSLDHFLVDGKPLMLLFTNPKCGPCVNLFSEIKDWQVSHGDQLTITLISRGTIKENFVSVARNGLGQVLLQEKTEIAELYRAQVTPSAVIVNSEGRIASSVAAGADEIRQLLRATVSQ